MGKFVNKFMQCTMKGDKNNYAALFLYKWFLVNMQCFCIYYFIADFKTFFSEEILIQSVTTKNKI